MVVSKRSAGSLCVVSTCNDLGLSKSVRRRRYREVAVLHHDLGLDRPLAGEGQRRATERGRFAGRREIDWWTRGSQLFGGLVDPEEADADALLHSLLPVGAVPRRPTLRQAIMLVMRAGPHKDWSVDALSSMLAMNNWLPKVPDPTSGLATRPESW